MPLLRYKPILILRHNKNNIGDFGRSNIKSYNQYGSSSNKYNKFSNGVLKSERTLNINMQLGGEFTVGLWATLDISLATVVPGTAEKDISMLLVEDNNYFFGFGHTRTNGIIIEPYARYGSKSANKIIGSYNISNFNKKTLYYEFDRDKNGNMYLFCNGKLLGKAVWGIQRDNLSFNIFAWYVDELMATQHCLHTSNFTPPTSPYWWSDGYKIYDEQSDQYTMTKGSDEIAIL